MMRWALTYSFHGALSQNLINFNAETETYQRRFWSNWEQWPEVQKGLSGTWFRRSITEGNNLFFIVNITIFYRTWCGNSRLKISLKGPKLFSPKKIALLYLSSSPALFGPNMRPYPKIPFQSLILINIENSD